MTTTQEKPKSYTTRLKEFLEEKKVSKKTIDLISEFAMEEAEKMEKQREATIGIMTFGKFKGKQLSKINEIEPTYIKWLAKNEKYLSEENREIVKQLIQQ